MKCRLIRENNSPIDFNIENIINITANGGQLFVKLSNYITHAGIKIIPVD